MVLLKMGCAYILTIDKYKHKYLAWVLKYDREWLVEWAIPACDIPEDIEIVDAAFAVQETGLDPDTHEFWAAVDAILDEKRVNDGGDDIETSGVMAQRLGFQD